jgi:hypothetical protein
MGKLTNNATTSRRSMSEETPAALNHSDQAVSWLPDSLLASDWLSLELA